ncbi:MAG: N-acetylmuramidase family protein, partial [Candidatus Adiutrix sp.]|nr:N-acetylmuramidase family protein [Candidatus Adiutrix sp.]
MPQVKTLTDEQIKAAAEGAGLEYAALKAVVVVESSGAGFLDDGQPKILFEGHVFWKQLEALGLDPAQLAQGNGDILHSMWDKSKYQGGAAEHQRLHRAARLSPGPAPPGLSPGPSPAGNEPALDSAALAGGVDELFSLGPLAPAALCSVSWGLFKIMGFNWRLCGYKS